MKYKCLILDHDDTVVNSTATIHYPSFIEYLKVKRPGRVDEYTFEDFIKKNFNPGIFSLFRDELQLSFAEIDEEQKFWERFVKNVIPTAYDGIRELIKEFRLRGGIIAVCSHSMQHFIERDYRANNLPMPDAIYGWDLPRDKRKPSTYAVDDLCVKYGLDKSQFLMVDDLKPGYDMAKNAGIDFAAAGWAYNVPEVADFMRAHSDFYLENTADLRRVAFME